MPNTELQNLPEVVTPTLADLVYLLKNGISSKASLGNLLANLPSVTFSNAHTFPSIFVAGGTVYNTIVNNVADGVLLLKNLHTHGFPAVRFDSSDGKECAAFGYGNPESSGPFTDRAFWETSGTAADAPPKEMIVVTTVINVRHKRVNFSTDHKIYFYKWESGSPFVDLNETPMLTLDTDNGRAGIATTSPTSALQVVGLPMYPNNASAISGGLTAGAFYRTGGDPDSLCVVH